MLCDIKLKYTFGDITSIISFDLKKYSVWLGNYFILISMYFNPISIKYQLPNLKKSNIPLKILHRKKGNLFFKQWV